MTLRLQHMTMPCPTINGNYSQGVGTRIIISERKTKARPLITCFKSGKELKHMEHPYKKWYIYICILQHAISLLGIWIVFNFAESVPFAFLAYYSTQTESLLSFVDMPGSWGLVGVKKASMPGWVDVIMIWYISKRPEASTAHILYSTVDVYWICHTSKPWFVEIPWSYGSSMVSEIQRLKCLNSKLLRNPRLALKRVFLGTQWGSWDHEHWMHIKKGIDFQFLLVSHILW